LNAAIASQQDHLAVLRGEERNVFGVLRGRERGVDLLELEPGLFLRGAQSAEDGLALLVAADGQQPAGRLRHGGQQQQENHGGHRHDAERPGVRSRR
jgi:hypothetical protein